MNMMTTIRPSEGEPLLAFTTQRVTSRVYAVAAAIGGLIDTAASRKNALLAGSVMPFANTVITGTNCSRPLWFAECNDMAQTSDLDVVLLRFDPDRGATFDILDHQSLFWRCNHLAWRRRDGDLWFIPQAGFDGFVRATAWGLEYEPEPPFVSASERHAGIIRAIENPSFTGRI
jgi:hypothetical protein